jgi:hypothetical protein
MYFLKIKKGKRTQNYNSYFTRKQFPKSMEFQSKKSPLRMSLSQLDPKRERDLCARLQLSTLKLRFRMRHLTRATLQSMHLRGPKEISSKR